MSHLRDIFKNFGSRPATEDHIFSEDEVRLANRNSGTLLETLEHDVTPTGLHYLLIHFDVPRLSETTHRLEFGKGFDAPFSLSMDDIRALPAQTIPVTLECAGNGRSGLSPRAHSMPWGFEAVGTYEWTGTALAPLLERAQPEKGTVDIVFTGADRGFDKGVEHAYGRSLSLQQIAELEVLLVYGMNGQPLLPQHGAPLRIIVPGWYGMASVKWLSSIEALAQPYQGFQQVRTYRYRDHKDDPGRPVTSMRVKSLMTPPGVPDFVTRLRYVQAGQVTVSGRAWSGDGASIIRVEFNDGNGWQKTHLSPTQSQYDWTRWTVQWDATPGEHVLSCKATDSNGVTQPLEPVWDAGGFGNNAVQHVQVWVEG